MIKLHSIIVFIVTIMIVFCASCREAKYNSLIKASKNGDLTTIRTLIEDGCKVDCADNFKVTPLMYASFYGYDEIVSLLITSGANPILQDSHGCTALMWAIRRSHLDYKETYKNGNFEINSQSGKKYNGDSFDFYYNHSIASKPQIIYATKSRDNIIKMLLADPNVKSNVGQKTRFGHTALFFAVHANNEYTVSALIKNKADINVLDESKRTPLHYACLKGFDNIVSILIDNGAQIDLPDDMEETALLYAVKMKHKKTVELLIDNGADLNLEGKNGKTALDNSIFHSYKEIEQLLRSHGAKTAAELQAEKEKSEE